MSNSRKRWGTASKVLSTALSAALVVALTPAVAWGSGESGEGSTAHQHVDGETTKCDLDVASLTHYASEDDPEGTTTYYSTVAAAINAAVDQDNVALIDNVELSAPLVVDKSIFLYGNQKTISLGESFSGDSAITISAAGATLSGMTIDGSTEGSARSQYGILVNSGGNRSVGMRNTKISGFRAAAKVLNDSNLYAYDDIDVLENTASGFEVAGKSILDLEDATIVENAKPSTLPIAVNDSSVISYRDEIIWAPKGKSLFIKTEPIENNMCRDSYYLNASSAGSTPLTAGTLVDNVYAPSTANACRVFSFETGEAGGTYSFYSEGAEELNNPKATLYSASGNELASNDDAVEGGDYNFQVTANLAANTTYLLYVSAVDSSNTFSVGVKERSSADITNYAIDAKDCFYTDDGPISVSNSGMRVIEKGFNTNLIGTEFDVEIQVAQYDQNGKLAKGDKVNDITKPDVYQYVATRKGEGDPESRTIRQEFTLYHSKRVHSYWYTASNVGLSDGPVSLARLNLKMGRLDSDTCDISTDGKVKVKEWLRYDPSAENKDEEGYVGLGVDSDGSPVVPTEPGHYCITIVGINEFEAKNCIGIAYFDVFGEKLASVPTGATLTYNGSNQQGVKDGVGYTLDGDELTAKDVGEYYVAATLKDGYAWSDGIASKTRGVDWSIVPAKVTAPIAKSGLIYNGSYQYGVSSGSGYTLTGTTYAANAGTYYPVAKLNDKKNYTWSDGTTADRTITWSIAPAKIAIPAAVMGLKYTGSVQYGVTAASGVTLSGTYSATNAGTYTAYASLPNTSTTHNYQWSDYTTGAKAISWSIAKGSLPVSMTSSKATIYTDSTYDVGYSYAGDGAITATSSNTAVATVAMSATKTVTVTPKAAGVAVITVSAAGTSNCLSASSTIVITVSKPAAAPSGSFINADGSFAGGSNGGVPGSASDAQQAAASYKVTTATGSSTATVTYLGGAKSGSATIPSTVKDQNGVTYRVTAVAKSAFKGTKITKVSLGSYVKTIGSSAFSGCSKLTSLTIGKSVSSIGTSAIKGCSKLKTVTLKSSKLSKTSIKNLVKGTKVTTIKCSGLSKQVIAKYLKWAKAYNKMVKVK